MDGPATHRVGGNADVEQHLVRVVEAVQVRHRGDVQVVTDRCGLEGRPGVRCVVRGNPGAAVRARVKRVKLRKRYLRHAAIIAVMYIFDTREIDVTALIGNTPAPVIPVHVEQVQVDTMYNPAMSTEPEVPDEVSIAKVRNQLAEVIEKARYFDGVTFLTNRGRRVAAIVPVEAGEQWVASAEQRTARES